MSTQRNRWTHTHTHTNTMECSSASKKGSLTFERGNTKTSHQRISQCSSGWPQIHYLDQAGLALRAPPASVSGIKGMCHHRAAQQLPVYCYTWHLFSLPYILSHPSLVFLLCDHYVSRPVYHQSPLYPYAETNIPSLLPVLSTNLLCPEMYLS